MTQREEIWTKLQLEVFVRGAKRPEGPSVHLWWKGGWYARVVSILPGNRVRIRLTEGKCAC